MNKLEEVFTEAPMTGMGLNVYSDLVEHLRFGMLSNGLTAEGCQIALRLLKKLKVEVIEAVE